jgi:membrane protease YdiL (CAAX protease family)
MPRAPSAPSLSIRLPTWQIVVVLLSPSLFLINARMPWAQELWAGGDKSYYYAFWTSIVLLYCVTSGVACSFLNQATVNLEDIGMRFGLPTILKAIGALVVLGLAAVVFREFAGYENTDDLGLQVGWPANTTERLFWIPIYIAAGFFEEFVYRGVAIPALRGRGVPTWLAIAITSAAFSLIHGGASWLLTGITFVIGLVLAGIYMWRRDLGLVMIIHAVADWSFILTP